jgi:hypothetical protein
MSPPRLLSLHAAAPSAPALAPGRTIPIHRPSSTSPAGCLAPAAPGNRLPSAVRCAPGDFAERVTKCLQEVLVGVDDRAVELELDHGL